MGRRDNCVYQTLTKYLANSSAVVYQSVFKKKKSILQINYSHPQTLPTTNPDHNQIIQGSRDTNTHPTT